MEASFDVVLLHPHFPSLSPEKSEMAIPTFCHSKAHAGSARPQMGKMGATKGGGNPCFATGKQFCERRC